MNTTPITFAGIFEGFEERENVLIKTIEIPIIQRDYAQGRESKDVGRIRKQFLDSLHKAITSKKQPIKLDFVYGNVINGKLIPLDGQQRLTTLFLLHWYISKHEQVAKEETRFLKNFTYKTRFSSQHFCESLVESEPDFSSDKLSNWIADQSWFMYSWEKDPTIQSMLVMLDDIHDIFKNEYGLWPKLTHDTNPVVSFYFLALEDMGLTDSLYIKMNSRGKPLTEFEHFKADFERIIQNVSKTFYDEFIHKADKDWVDMLWNCREEDDDNIDDEFMRYYRFITEMLCYQQEIEIVENDFELSEKVYGILNDNAKDNLRFLFNCLDCWNGIEIPAFFESVFSKFEYKNGKVQLYTEDIDLFMQCCRYYGDTTNGRRRFSLNNMLILYAMVRYLNHKNQVSEQLFAERIRIVRNLILNSSDEIRESRMQGLLSDIESIIVNGVVNTKSLGFNETQKSEEIEKIKWRQDNLDLIESLNRLEDHFLLQGTIAIIGLADPEHFKKRSEQFIKLFNHSIGYLTISRALLTIDDYSQLASWRFLFGNNNDSTWRELFTVSNQRKRFEITRNTVIQLLDSLEEDTSDYLQRMINSYLSDSVTPKDWRYYFIKYPEMRQGNSGVYWWKNDNTKSKNNPYEIYMMNTSLSLNGKHWDPFLYVLSKDELLKKETTLDEYGADLIINNTNHRLRCRNANWEFLDGNNTSTISIPIPQTNGVDTEDRIEMIKDELYTILDLKNSN